MIALKFDRKYLKQDKVTFIHKQVVNVYLMYEINLWEYKQNGDFKLGNSLFGANNLTKNADFDKYKYFGYGIVFDILRSFSLSDGGWLGKNVVIFGADMS